MGVRYPARVAERSRPAGAATSGAALGRSWIEWYRCPLADPLISAMMPLHVAQSGVKWGGEVKRSGRSTAVVAEVGDR